MKYVMFMGQERETLLDYFSPPGFRHVLAFWFDSRIDGWVIYNVCGDRTAINVLYGQTFDRWLLIRRRAGSRILAVPAGVENPRRILFSPYHCVTAVAHAVGTKSRALRPIALWRDLLREGANEAFIGHPVKSTAVDHSKTDA